MVVRSEANRDLLLLVPLLPDTLRHQGRHFSSMEKLWLISLWRLLLLLSFSEDPEVEHYTSTRLPGFDSPSTRRGLEMSRRSLYRGGPYDSWSILAGGMPNFQRFRGENDHHRTNLSGCYKEHSLTWSDGVPTSSFRGTAPSDTHFRDTSSEEKGKKFFLVVMVLTIIFPPVGILALSGVFDSTISWCTHGELSAFTVDQRGTLKQQLIVEAILYPVLIIALAVSYSLSG
ncbi:unnamed protein product, partial [Clonostachys chloroleuca]